METELRKIAWASSLTAVFLCGVYLALEARLQGFVKYRGYLDLNHANGALELRREREVLRQEDENESINQGACRALLRRIVKEEGAAITGFTVWEDSKYIYCEPGRITNSWYDLAIGSNVVHIRKRDGRWKQGGSDWKTLGYVHMRVKDLLAIAAEKGSMSHLIERCGKPYRNVGMPVLLNPGDSLSGTVLTNGLLMKNSDRYQLWRYDCIDGVVDVVVDAQERVVWCHPIR